MLPIDNKANKERFEFDDEDKLGSEGEEYRTRIKSNLIYNAFVAEGFAKEANSLGSQYVQNNKVIVNHGLGHWISILDSFHYRGEVRNKEEAKLYHQAKYNVMNSLRILETSSKRKHPNLKRKILEVLTNDNFTNPFAKPKLTTNQILKLLKIAKLNANQNDN